MTGYWTVAAIRATRCVTGLALARATKDALLTASETSDAEQVIGLGYDERGWAEMPEDTRVPPIEIDVEWVAL